MLCEFLIQQNATGEKGAWHVQIKLRLDLVQLCLSFPKLNQIES